MKKQFTFLFLFFISVHSFAQIPSTSDCVNSIAICTIDYYQQNAVYGAGNFPYEIDTVSSCLEEGEQDDTWYQFYTVDSGYITFLILPDSSGDYDFDMYNMNGLVCADIVEAAGSEVSCNWAASTDSTGAILIGDTSWQGEFGNQYNAVIPVHQDELYTLIVNHFSGFQGGYHIDFSGSTALFTAPPVAVTNDLNVLHSSMNGQHFQWYLNGNPLPGDTMKDLVATVNGLYSVSVTYFGGCLSTSTFFNYNNSSVSSILYNNAVSVFPNPASENFDLSFGLIKNSPVKIELFNAIGQAIHVLNIENYSSGNHKISFNKRDLNLASGIYQIHVSGNGFSVWDKVVIE